MDTDRTYTLQDLHELDFPGTPLAVLGYPVKHSVSPAMHNAAIAVLQEQASRFRDWQYYRFEIEPERLAEALPLFHRKNFLGLNLTVPHKIIAMDLVQGVSADGQRIGAVNTLVWDELGYDGFNTDGYGIKTGLQVDLAVELPGAHVMLLGSGGAARAAAVQCVTDNCDTLYIGNRSPERLQDLLSTLGKIPSRTRIVPFALGDVPSDLPEQGVVINATSLGLKDADGAPIDITGVPADWTVYDMIYNPEATTLLKAASARGLRTANGLSMLVHQGARSLEIWSHMDVDDHAMMNAARHALNLPPRNYV
ncbi:shikimate dehydrogenase family protein [Coraliomargarita akajimensis]|uniref:Shikimate dehydrogenase (NADP(+)) n=1 Tax=Coraliomargarita akajimensis (strain DSM 45221 / IAM 15411 / JCM 23193 / KCTC 12865 / 04OKA010-24) TaxID=583355 RepID=D5EN05_CORAD|nr:shikimate dehydrogenase [Coraliomargarita akajimensis]ADE53440.1 shikimate 5-dehydrogenase [Coraliomargarita akajimensis DSM 45221]